MRMTETKLSKTDPIPIIEAEVLDHLPKPTALRINPRRGNRGTNQTN
jgi:hypothetical protein